MKTVLEHPLKVRNSLFKAIPRSLNWRDPMCNVFPRCVMVWNPLGGTSVVRNESTAINKLPEVTFTSSLCHLPSARFWPMTALVLSKKDFTYAAWRRPFSKAKPKKDWKLIKRSFKFALLYFVIIVRIDYRKNWLISVKKIFISIQKETRVVQWWQQSPPTSLLLVLADADWAACRLLFSSLLLKGVHARFARRTQKEGMLEAYGWERFFSGRPIFPPSREHFQIPIWSTVVDEESLSGCVTLNFKGTGEG